MAMGSDIHHRAGGVREASLFAVTETMSQRMSDLPRVRAPEFPSGLDWIHTGGQAPTLAALRGKVVLLDFWTYG
jgi:hypothetical protein